MHKCSNFKFGAVQKCIDRVDLVKSFPTIIIPTTIELDPNSNDHSLAKIGVDTAENEPYKISDFIPTQAIQVHICILSPSDLHLFFLFAATVELNL